MPNFISKLDGAQNLKKNQDRKRVLVIFTDEEWDINQLRDGFAENPNDTSGYTTREAVTKRVHEVGKIKLNYLGDIIRTGVFCRFIFARGTCDLLYNLNNSHIIATRIHFHDLYQNNF